MAKSQTIDVCVSPETCSDIQASNTKYKTFGNFTNYKKNMTATQTQVLHCMEKLNLTLLLSKIREIVYNE